MPKTRTKHKKLTLEERLELGAQDHLDFKASLMALPDFEERMKKADKEIDLWIERETKKATAYTK